MKKQYFINANIVDPYNSVNENGGLIVGENGKIEAIGKKVNTNNLPTREKPIDLKGKYIFPGLVDMRVFVGEPGYEYKENFRTLSNAALSGGVTSVVTMPNTDPVIDLIQTIVCKFFKISKNEMLSSRRSRYLVRPRQTAIYLTKILTSKSLPEIGREFSNRDHTTIIHSVKTIEKIKEKDPEMVDNINKLKNQILYNNKENEI